MTLLDMHLCEVWCGRTSRMVQVKGTVEKLANGLDKLMVHHCVFENGYNRCRFRGKKECLIGKEIQGRFP